MKILIAAGGTGGHLFPGIAIAETFMRRKNTIQLLFIGTGKELERRVLSREGYPSETIDAVGLRGRHPLHLPTALFRVIKSFFQSMIIIRRYAPDLVIGLGGYVSGPVILAAALMGIKTVLHEQNTIPGLTNRILGRVAHRIFVSFDCTQNFFPRAKTILVGNPVRRPSVPTAETSSLPFTLLVVGGSLGSHQLNHAMCEALSLLSPIRDSLYIIHQTGARDRTSVQETYRREGFRAEVVPFLDPITSAYQRAHLVICRAGATTLAELMFHHKPSILIPYPLATDRHQHLNASFLVNQRAALMIDPDQLNGTRLARLILHLYHHPAELSEMGRNAGSLAKPHAAEDLVEHCMKLITGEQCTGA